jgi:hypothetical protein
MYPISKEDFNKLPLEIQKQCKDTLRAYNEITVTYYNGKYHASTAYGIQAKYPKDYKYIGVVYQEDMYTLEERTQNYIEEFHDYPSWYKGKRDYIALKKKYGEPPVFD